MLGLRLIPDLALFGSLTSGAPEARRQFRTNEKALRQLITNSTRKDRLPDEVIEDLVAGGILRLLLPGEFGGLEIDGASVLLILEELGTVSGSLAWTAMVACDTPVLLSLLPRSTFESLYANGPDVLLASSSIPAGIARKVAGGWRISGSWPFVSGNSHCELVLTHSRDSDGATIASVHPRSDVVFVDDWRSLGLRATSSNSVQLANAWVPDSHTFVVGQAVSCLETPEMAVAPSEHFALQMAAVAVGIVRHVIEVARRAKGRVGRSPKRKFEDAALLSAVGEAVALTKIARPALKDAMVELMQRSAEDDGLVGDASPASLAVARYIVARCVASADAVFSLSGSSVVFEGDELQECTCDLRCIAQHANLSPGRFAQLGERVIECSVSSTSDSSAGY